MILIISKTSMSNNKHAISKMISPLSIEHQKSQNIHKDTQDILIYPDIRSIHSSCKQTSIFKMKLILIKSCHGPCNSVNAFQSIYSSPWSKKKIHNDIQLQSQALIGQYAPCTYITENYKPIKRIQGLDLNFQQSFVFISLKPIHQMYAKK